MSELSFTIEDRAGLPVLIDRRGGVRSAGLHERAMWKRIKELEAKLRAVGGLPGKWRTWRYGGKNTCADELEALLK